MKCPVCEESHPNTVALFNSIECVNRRCACFKEGKCDWIDEAIQFATNLADGDDPDLENVRYTYRGSEGMGLMRQTMTSDGGTDEEEVISKEEIGRLRLDSGFCTCVACMDDPAMPWRHILFLLKQKKVEMPIPYTITVAP